MAQESGNPILTAVFVDYDNIYLSLKKRSPEAAKRFSKDAASWIKEIENGRLISATNSPEIGRPRRIVLNRCYGNPVPRRNQHDNSTDMNSFPFIRHHFLRAGFEVIDCPPLTAQLKNSSDIKMVMDVRDFLTHETRFDEFVILSGDADFTPVLHRLRAHARHTVIFANDFTAAPYTALADGEIKESHLLAAVLEGRIAQQSDAPEQVAQTERVEIAGDKQIAPDRQIADRSTIDRVRAEIIAAVVTAVRGAGGPVPLEALAERTTRALGHDRTVGSGWAGAGGFLELLRGGLPAEIQLTNEPPYLAYEVNRNIAAAPPSFRVEPVQQAEPKLAPPAVPQRSLSGPPLGALNEAGPEPAARAPQPRIEQPSQPSVAAQPQQGVAIRAAANMASASPGMAPPIPKPQATQPPSAAQLQRQADAATGIQQSIARIHDACQAPPLSPPEYRSLFDLIAKEINQNGLQGSQTLSNMTASAQDLGIAVKRDDVRFIMEVVSEADPWFEQGASANLFAGRFRNFVVARCRGQGLNLSSDELDLIEAWFAGNGQPLPPQGVRPSAPGGMAVAQNQQTGGGWGDGGRADTLDDAGPEEFPKILRTRLRG